MILPNLKLCKHAANKFVQHRSTSCCVHLTYPIELIKDAMELCREAEQAARARPRPEICSPEERRYARSAIFTAFNFVESLLTELVQGRIRDDGSACAHCAARIQQDIQSGRASISRTIYDWPKMLTGKDLSFEPVFQRFEKHRLFRNNLVHPTLVPAKKGALDQDSLLKATSAQEAREFVQGMKDVAAKLYVAFGAHVPRDLEAD